MAGRIEFAFGFSDDVPRWRRRDDASAPLRILVMGDFTARDARVRRDAEALAGRRMPAVDVDTFDDVLARTRPSLPWAGAPDGKTLAFTSMDEFHPDHLYKTLPVFERMRDLRSRLQDPAEMRQAVAEVGSLLGASSAPGGTGAETDAAAIERLLGAAPSPPRAPTAAAGMLDRLIADAVRPHIVPDAPANHATYLAAVDDALASHMRGVLHHPAFQALEAAWRGVQWIVTELGASDSIRIHLLDVSKRELAADLASAAGDLERSAVHMLLSGGADAAVGGGAWSVLTGLYRFGPDADDLELLAGLGAVAAAAGGPFLAAADPRIAGAGDIAVGADHATWQPAGDESERWAALRASGVAPWIGLALPRILLRVPYGKDSDEIDAFPFEELPSTGEHEAYLWGNPAVGVTLLLGRAFDQNAWEMEPGDVVDLADLPAHVYDDRGERVLKPCAEALLSERAATRLLELGLMPLASFRDRNAIRVPRVQSIALPAAALAGQWGSARS